MSLTVTPTLTSIRAFAQRTRLSHKGLRLYAELGLLPPAWIDPETGYRFYRSDQVDRARLIGLLRRLDTPLARISPSQFADGFTAVDQVASPAGHGAALATIPNRRPTGDGSGATVGLNRRQFGL